LYKRVTNYCQNNLDSWFVNYNLIKLKLGGELGV